MALSIEGALFGGTGMASSMPTTKAYDDHLSVMIQVRTFRDDRGVDWEVYDESDWGARGPLDWDYLPQSANPGLIFVSALDMRRLWPAPPNWHSLSDAELNEACCRAVSVS